MKCPHCGGTFELPKARGTRLPTPFMLTADMRDWAKGSVPLVDIKFETEKFCDYWRSAPGQRGIKLDWVATWRNWMRSAQAELPAVARPANVSSHTVRNTVDPAAWVSLEEAAPMPEELRRKFLPNKANANGQP